jgi:molybdopterin converting factor small subunit
MLRASARLGRKTITGVQNLEDVLQVREEERVMKLAKFRAKYMARLQELRQRLLSKYPEKRERIEYIVDVIMNKLENLRTHTLADYVFTLYLASKEFPEFSELTPTTNEIEEILEEDDKGE